MKQILNIAKAECRHLFFSPLAWASILVLMIIFCYDYITVLTTNVNYAELGGSSLLQLQNLTAQMTLNCPYQALVMRLLVLHCKFILPFLFIGIISREYASGTIRLIQSSPTLIRNFVWGKFAGLAAFCALIVMLFSIIIAFLAFSIKSPDIVLLLWELFSIFLYFIFLGSICLFSSSLSKHPIVGGLISIVIIIVFNLIGSFAQSSIFADFLYPLSHRDIILRIQDGGVDLNDLIVLLAFTSMFVLLTVVKMENDMKNRSIARKIFHFSFVAGGVVLLIAALPYRPIAFFDLTRTKSQTLHPVMQQLLKKMDEGPLEVTHYVNIISFPFFHNNYTRPEGKAAAKYDTWRSYMLYKKDISVNFKYYYAIDSSDAEVRKMLKSYRDRNITIESVAKLMANTYGYDFSKVQTLEDISKEIDIKAEANDIHLIKLKYKNRETVIRTYRNGASLPGDINLYAAFDHLIADRRKEMFVMTDGNPKSIFLKRNSILERRSDGAWKNIGPLIDSVRLATNEIDDNAKSLLALGPRAPLPDMTVARVKRFIDSGGNLLIASEPAYKEFVQPLIDYVGAAIKKEIIAQPIPSFGSQNVIGCIDNNAYPYLRYMDSAKSEFRRIHLDTLNISMPLCSGIDLSGVKGFEVLPLAQNDPAKSWNIPALQNYDSLNLQLNRNNKDENGALPLLVLLTRKINGKRQNIIISGDADFLSFSAIGNLGEKIQPHLLRFHMDLYNDLLALLTNDLYPGALFRQRNIDNDVTITKKGAYVQQVVIMYIFPSLILIAGLIILIKRKRK